MVVSKTEFSKLAQVSKGYVTNACTRGKLVPTPDGYIDTKNPVNAAYLVARGYVEPEQPKQKKQQPASTRLESLDGVDLPDADGDVPPDQLDKLSVDIRLKLAQALRHELKFAQDKGDLVPLELVERMVSKVNAEIRIRLSDLPARITPRLASLAKSGAEDREVQTVLEREIDDALEAVKKSLVMPK